MTDTTPRPGADVEALRPVNGASALLRAYGAALPPEVEEARALHHRLRQSPPAEADLRMIGAIALDESPKTAAKALTEARVAIEVHRAALKVAIQRAVSALAAHADEVSSAVLTSPLVRTAAEEIAAVAPSANPSVARYPAPGTPEDDVVAAARLRRAEEIIEKAATGIEAVGVLGGHFEADRVGLLWISPFEVTDRRALSLLARALRGVRNGHSGTPVMVPRLGTDGPVRDDSGDGVRSAAAAAVDGVRFAMVDSLDEYEERLRYFETALARPREEVKAGSHGTKVAVLDD